MILNEQQVENPLVGEKENIASIVKITSFDTFKELLIEMTSFLGESERLSIAVNPSLLQKLNADDFFKKMSMYADNGFEDTFSLPVGMAKSETKNIDLLHQFNADMRSLLDAYHHLNMKKFNNCSLAELVNQYVTKPKKESLINLGQWYINVDEYSQKLNLLSEAAAIFEKIQISDWYDSQANAINDANDTAATVAYLNDAVVDLKNCKKTIETELQKLGKKWRKQAFNGFNLVYQQYTALHQKAMLFASANEKYVSKKPGILTFNKTEKLTFDTFERLKNDALALSEVYENAFNKNLNLPTLKSISEIENLLSKVNQDLSLWPMTIIKELNEKMSRVSTLNVSNETLAKSSSIVDDYIAEVNARSIWTKKIEINTNVFDKYLAFLDTFIDQCNKAIAFFSRENNKMEWSQYLHSLSVMDQSFLLKFINIHPSLWVEEFENSHCIKLLNALHHPLTVHNQELAKDIYAKYQLAKNLKADKAINHLADLFAMRYSMTSKAQPKLVKRFTKEKNAINKQDFYKEDLALIAATYPLTIRSTKDNSTNAVITLIQNQNEKTFEFSVQMDEPINQLKNINDKMHAIAMTERFSVASNLAKSLMHFVDTFSIFQLKNANIICLWPDELSQVLVNKLDGFGVKQFKVKGREEEALIESIIESNRNQVLLTLNGLPNYECPEEIIDQYKVMEAFINVGFNIANIWTVDLLDNDDRVFNALVEKLTTNP